MKRIILIALLTLAPTLALAQSSSWAARAEKQDDIIAAITGTSTEAKQDSIITALGNILTEAQAILAKLIAAPSTEAKQDDILGLLTTIDADTSNLTSDPATETTLALLGTEATLGTLCTEATAATLATETTVGTLATEATAATLALETGGNLDTLAAVDYATETTLGTVAVESGGNLDTIVSTQTDGSQVAQSLTQDGSGNAIDSSTGALAVYLEDGSGNPIQVVDYKLRTISMPYGYALAEGLIPGHAPIGSIGSREAVAVVATGSDVWNGTATTIPYPASAGEQLIIVSSSAQDDTGGTGVITVEIAYLDASGDPQSETIDLDGTTPVSLVETNVRFVQGFHATAVGANGAAVGDITIYQTGDATRIYSVIAAGTNHTISTMKMVPHGKTLYLTDSFVAAADKSVDIRLRATAWNNVLTEGIFISYGVASLNNATLSRHPTIPPKFPEFTIIKMTCYVPATKDGADVSAGWSGWIE